MVFGWGKKKEPAHQVPQNRSIALHEVSGIASDLLALRESQTVSEVRSYRDHIVPLLREISAIGRDLEADDLKVDNIDRNIRVIVIRGKKQVIDIIKKDVVELPDISTMQDAEMLHGMLNQILKKVGDALGRQTRVIHIFAKRYAGKLKEILAEINNNNAEIKRLLANLGGSRDTCSRIDASLDRIAGLRKSNAGADARLAALQESRKSYRDRLAACQKSITRIKSSERYAELQKQRDLLGRMESQEVRLRGRIMDQFTRISRPLGRYEYASSLDKEQKRLLSMLIKSPFEALTAENRDGIDMILGNVRRGVSSGSVSVKDVEKSLGQIDEISDALDGMISEISGYRSERNAIRDTIDGLTPEELPVLEKESEKLEYGMSDAESRMRSVEAEISANKSSIPDIIRGIEADLRRFTNTRYSIISEN